MTPIRAWITIAVLSTAAAGLSAGYLWGTRSARSDDADDRSVWRDIETSSSWLLRSRDVLAELALDPDQARRVEDVLAAHYRRASELQVELSQLSSSTNEALGSILSSEQVATLAKIRERYSEHHVEAEVFRELVMLQRKLELRPEQEPVVRQVIFDYLDAKHTLIRQSSRGRRGDDDAKRDEFRRKLRELSDDRFHRLESHMSAEQLATYREFVGQRERERDERRKAWEDRNRKQDREGGQAAEPKPAESACRERPAEPTALANSRPCEKIAG